MKPLFKVWDKEPPMSCLAAEGTLLLTERGERDGRFHGGAHNR